MIILFLFSSILRLSLFQSSIALRLANFDFILHCISYMLSFRDLISILYTPLMISCLEQ